MGKSIIVPAIAVGALVACGRSGAESIVEDKGRERTVTFVVGGISEEYVTRATLGEAGMTNLWIWEGTTLLKHTTSSDEDFAAPGVSLTYGVHELTFVASKAEGQSWTKGVWSTTKEVETFGAVETVTVSGETNRYSVQLDRRSARVMFVSTDNVPSGVKTLHLTVDNHKSLDKDLKGGDSYTHEGTVDMASMVGSTCTVTVNVLTASATDEEDTDVMIEFLDGSTPAKVLYHYERTVKLKANRCVSLKGEYFSGGSNVTIGSTGWSEVEEGLFSGEE